jgi:DNA-binding transcriptional LysR family regulator
LRIGLPTTYAHYRVLPLLPSFHARYPGVQVDVHIGNRNIDLVAEGYDLVVRARPQPDSTLIARKLEDAELVVVAAPEYLARAGVPESLEALSGHDCIQFVLPSSGRRVPWSFRREGTNLDLETVGSACCLEDLLGGITLARHGGGLYQAYRFTVAEDLAAGRLVEVLGAFGGRSRPFSVLYPSGRHLPLRTRVFIDFLFDALKV